jgi:hypothetical protein
MDLRETGLEVADGMRLAQYREQWRAVAKTVMRFWVL